jgi:hypothetical protein
MGTLTRLNSRTVFFVAITAFSIGALACFGGVTAKQSGNAPEDSPSPIVLLERQRQNDSGCSPLR